MKHIIKIAMTAIAVIAAMTTPSCTNREKAVGQIETAQQLSNSDTIPFSVTDHYFIRNDVDSVPEVVNSEVDFQKYFGMAPVMGNGGRPTDIDFKKQSVIVASLPVTDVDTELSPISLRNENGELVFSCKKNAREETLIHHTSIRDDCR